MTTHAVIVDAAPLARSRVPGCAVPPWLYALFFLSGVSGLLYEVVWLRQLSRLLGSTVYASATVLAAFMAGLALGSLIGGRFIDRARRPLRVYGLLELGIALAALGVLPLPEGLLPVYRTVAELMGGSRSGLTAAQVVVALVVLLLPSTLMGATLPALCAFGARRGADFGRLAGTLYALNTLGAVTGVVAAGFVLIGTVGETRTVVLGAALNGAAGLVALLLARRQAAAGSVLATFDQPVFPSVAPGLSRLVLTCFALSGCIALANEVVWARLLTLYQGTSVYAFSAMLAVLLAGMALGSLAGARLLNRWSDPLLVLALLQLALGFANITALHLFDAGAMLQPDLETGHDLGVLVWVPLALVGPWGVLAGVAFPVAVKCYAGTAELPGRRVAWLYAWNTAGSIAGALFAGFVLIPVLGAGRSGAALAAANLLLGVVLLAAHPRGYWSGSSWFVRVSFVVWCGVLVATVGDPYYRLLQRQMHQAWGPVTLYRHAEEAAGTTTAFGRVASAAGAEELWVNGHGMTGRFTATKLMAHLPIWLAEEPRDLLVVCFGMGTTARSASRHEGLRIWAVELVPAVLECFGHYHADGESVQRRPNFHGVVDDGRNYLLMHPQCYDVITIDPPPPLYSAGAVNLYSREFFQLCLERLQPGGVVCLWVPPGNESEVKMILRTFVEVFPHVSAWRGPDLSLEGIFLLGGRRPPGRGEERIRQGYGQAAVVADLTEWDSVWDRPEKILDLYVAEGRDLRGLVSGSPVITDDRPYTEFPLWRALFAQEEYHQQLTGRRLQEVLALRRSGGVTQRK